MIQAPTLGAARQLHRRSLGWSQRVEGGLTYRAGRRDLGGVRAPVERACAARIGPWVRSYCRVSVV